jgi:hypothetical protein
MNRATLPVFLLAAVLAAPPAQAQLGLDLGGSSATKREKKKSATKKDTGKKGKKAPTRRAPVEAEPPPPAPAPAPAPAAAPPASNGRGTNGHGLDLGAPPPVEARPSPAVPLPPPPSGTRRGPQPQTGLTLTPLDGKTSGEAKKRLDAAKKLLNEKATETACLALDQILRDPRLASAHDEARFLRAKSLARLGLTWSALSAFDEILEKGPSGTRYFQASMEWLFWLSRKLPNEQPILARVARHAGQGVPPSFEDRVNYFLAKYEFERGRALADAGRTGEAQGAWGEARRLASKVRDTDARQAAARASAADRDAPRADQGDVFARAKFIDGLVSYASGNDVPATDAFKDVVRLTNPKRGRPDDPELRELAFLQLARIHYQNRQNRYAIFYYGKMPWGGQRWLEGLWEASYAHYRIGDFEKTLGNLLTLQSPYFRDEYFPESYVLKAIVYYENCRYPEARQVLEQFSSLYDPLYNELARLTTTPRTPDAYYDLVRGGAASAGIARRVFKLAETDQAVARLVDSIGSTEKEMDSGLGRLRGEFRQAALGKDLRDRLSAERLTMVEEAGQRMRAKLEYERDQLRQLLASALRIKIEVSRKEREALEGSLATGSQVDVVKNLKFSYAVSDEHLYWPYEGEFWRDELGTYSYTLTKGCKDRLPRSRSRTADAR